MCRSQHRSEKGKRHWEIYFKEKDKLNLQKITPKK
jgi:hypothetical protein